MRPGGGGERVINDARRWVPGITTCSKQTLLQLQRLILPPPPNQPPSEPCLVMSCLDLEGHSRSTATASQNSGAKDRRPGISV
ncbi:hypothetical protein RRG08_017502 [Elysia crispata]|uniref:Uncharacterized protein n=1 Tax=Elysia crispata TaxID=231223 RepID=A0AAE1DE73_9GAST|nr:hypothetical protein RRG08_017502 [Elysia crispata]